MVATCVESSIKLTPFFWFAARFIYVTAFPSGSTQPWALDVTRNYETQSQRPSPGTVDTISAKKYYVERSTRHDLWRCYTQVTGMLLLPYSQVHVSGHDAKTERFFDAYSNNPCSFLYWHCKRPFHKLFEDFASDLPNTLGWRDLTYRQFRQIPKKKIHQVKSQYNTVFQIQTKAE